MHTRPTATPPSLPRAAGHALRTAPAELQQKLLPILHAWPAKTGHTTRAYVEALRQSISALVEAWGGHWQNSAYGDMRRLELICARGHTWQTRPMFLRNGQWCPHCYVDALRASLSDVQRLVRERHGGLCLSDSYTNESQALTWQCCHGHVWRSSFSNIKKGNWCPVCRRAERLNKRLGDMQALAAERGGECLSPEYVHSAAKLTWRCAHGHEWNAKPSSLASAHSWCPVCRYERQSLTLDDMQALAQRRGGRCLSEVYTGANRHLRWQCAHGHAWDATPAHIHTGRWCPTCAIDSLRCTIDEMHALAASRGGRCLSTTYVNGMSKLQWQCHRGHDWWATPSHVKDGTWCPQCFYLSRSIKEHKRLKYLPADTQNP